MLKLNTSEKGFTLIEVVVALAIMALVIVIFLLALATSGKALLVAQERTTAESLAKSQMESVKEQTYDPDGTYNIIDLTDYSEYSVWSVSVWSDTGSDTLVTGAVAVNWDTATNQASATDTGIQKIEIVIKNGDDIILTLEGYKVDR